MEPNSPQNNPNEPAMPLSQHPVYKDLMPRATEAQLAEMTASLQKYGQLQPIVVNEKGEILDGYTRYEVCKRLGVTPKCVVRQFASEVEEKAYVVDCGLSRRNLTIFQRLELVVLHLEPQELERAKQRRNSGLKQYTAEPLAQYYADEDTGRAREILAPKIPVSPSLYDKGSWLVRNAPKHVLDKVSSDELSISKAFSMYHRPKPKAKVQFSRNTVKVGTATLVQSRFESCDKFAIKGIALVIPSHDFSEDPAEAKKAAFFASSFLREGGFLVLYVRHTQLDKVLMNVRKAVSDLCLLYALPVYFDGKWTNVDSLPAVSGVSALYLIFGKADSANYFTDEIEFNEPLTISPNPSTDNADDLIRPIESNPAILGSLMTALRLVQGDIVCDPMLVDEKLATTAVKIGLDFIGVHDNAKKLEVIKKALECFTNVELAEMEETEDSNDLISAGSGEAQANEIA
jgi:ParB-like chromosome segregation protein Spo0J